jgi:hypothetical protein
LFFWGFPFKFEMGTASERDYLMPQPKTMKEKLSEFTVIVSV